MLQQGSFHGTHQEQWGSRKRHDKVMTSHWQEKCHCGRVQWVRNHGETSASHGLFVTAPWLENASGSFRVSDQAGWSASFAAFYFMLLPKPNLAKQCPTVDCNWFKLQGRRKITGRVLQCQRDWMTYCAHTCKTCIRLDHSVLFSLYTSLWLCMCDVSVAISHSQWGSGLGSTDSHSYTTDVQC